MAKDRINREVIKNLSEALTQTSRQLVETSQQLVELQALNHDLSLKLAEANTTLAQFRKPDVPPLGGALR